MDDQIEAGAGSEEIVSPPDGEREPAPAPTIEVADEYKPRIDKWYHFDNFNCKLCPWNTVEGIEAFSTHIYLAHILPAAQGYQES